MPDDKLADLRKPFPAGTVGKLPKGGRMLDYVGHAAVTDRLLTVDPTWTWEPLGTTPEGLPALDGEKNLWIRLTVCGQTRIGVGDGPTMKERVGDALRNAAMRFGVALDLWSKEELESGHAEARPAAIDVTVEKNRILAAVDGDVDEARRQTANCRTPDDFKRVADQLVAVAA